MSLSNEETTTTEEVTQEAKKRTRSPNKKETALAERVAELELENETLKASNENLANSIITESPNEDNVQEQLDNLKAALEHIATHTGAGNILHKYNMKKYAPTTAEMNRNHLS